MADIPYVILTYIGPVGPFETLAEAKAWGTDWGQKNKSSHWGAYMQTDQQIDAYKKSPVPILDPYKL